MNDSFKTEDRVVELSCLDADCDGVMECSFEIETESCSRHKDCPECGHEYTFVLNSWNDTPDDEYSLNIFA